jgi:hypothetical protein
MCLLYGQLICRVRELHFTKCWQFCAFRSPTLSIYGLDDLDSIPSISRTFLCLHHLGGLRIGSFIHQWFYSPLLGPGLFFSYVITFTQTVGLLGLVMSPLQGSYLYTGQHKHRRNVRTHAHTQRHPCLEWYSNPRSQRSSERRQFMP